VANPARRPLPRRPREAEPQPIRGPSPISGFGSFRLVAAEQIEQGAQGLAALALEMRIAFEHEPGVVMGDQLMGGEIRRPQARQSALPHAQHLAVEQPARPLGRGQRWPKAAGERTAESSGLVTRMNTPT
jgi:hypothetical protein